MGDATKAHRRVHILEKDWGLLACRVRDSKVWLNKVGTFGVGSAGYYWTRLASAIHRLGYYVISDKWEYEALLFSDDWLAVGSTREELEDIVCVVFFMSLLGFPWNWKKFRGGDTVAWIGYEINLSEYLVGISVGRAKWLADWVEKVLDVGFVQVNELESVVGRFGFAMIPLDFLRPFLAPVYAWLASVRGAGRLKIPWSISFLLRFLINELTGKGRLKEVKLLSGDLGEAFRADAKAEGGLVRIGGWECLRGCQPKEARWFSVELSRATAPWAFSRGEPYRSIAALELFATLMCVVLFSPKWPASTRGAMRLSGTTDNQGNSWALSRLMSTKFPLVLVLGELAYQLRERDIALHLHWAPREQNEEADALTNEDFSAFSLDRRMEVVWADIQFLILPDLMRVSEEIYQSVTGNKRKSEKIEGPSMAARPKVKLRTRDPWVS